jgi:DNA adenine methylase
MGSKARIAKYILPIILKDRKEGQWYVEPFVGGANMIDRVTGNRIGADINPYLIALYVKLQKGWIPLINITNEFYQEVKNNKDKFPDHIVGYLGFGFSFGARFFGGFVGNVNDVCCVGRDRIGESYRNILKTQKSIKDIHFFHKSYNEFAFTKSCIIYCDPPYANTTKYKSGGFDHAEFWQWCREKSKEGHQVFISEYNAPDDFKCVWSMDVSNTLSKKADSSKTAIEKLFIYAPH